MAIFTGSAGSETITPTFVSGTVFAFPFGSLPSAAADNIAGNDGNDTIDGGGGADIVSGGNGNDQIDVRAAGDFSGDAGNDTFLVFSSNASTTIDGGSGIDTLDPQGVLDISAMTLVAFSVERLALDASLFTLTGSQLTTFDDIIADSGATVGNMVLSSAGSATTNVSGLLTLNVTASSGNDVLFFTATGINPTDILVSGGGGNDTLRTGEGDDVLTGGSGDDTLSATGGDDSLNGGIGNDSLLGGEGDDTLNGGGGADTADGGNGNDLIFAVLGTPETIIGGAGIDTLDTTAFGGNYAVNLATGLTNFAGESFTQMENIVSGVGNDTLVGTAGANDMNGGGGNDSVNGGAGNDLLIGGSGDDTLNGGGGADTADGGAGNDLIFAVLGTPETIIGGLGIDTLDTTAFAGNYAVNLATGLTNFAGESFTQMENIVSGAGSDTLVGTLGNNEMDGGAGSDLIRGEGGRDQLNGGSDNDTLIGGLGNDKLSGGGGDDLLIGGSGKDKLKGQGGDDLFRFEQPSDGSDKISDFTSGDDLLQIDASGFGGGLVGGVPLAAGQLVVHASNAATAPAGTGQFIFNTGTSTLLWDQDGVGGVGAVKLAKLAGILSLATTDFDIIA